MTQLGIKLQYRPELLLHPPLPKPMHGVCPREIIVGPWWERQRQAAFAKYDYHCHACGVHKSDAAFHKWLEAHESYEIDFNAGTMTYIEAVGLCHACHGFIHYQRLTAKTERGEIPRSKFDFITKHGNQVLAAAGLVKQPTPESSVRWEDWRMIIFGDAYPPFFANEQAWRDYYQPENKPALQEA